MKRHTIKNEDRDKMDSQQDWVCADCGDGRTMLLEHQASPAEFFRLCTNCSEVYKIEKAIMNRTPKTVKWKGKVKYSKSPSRIDYFDMDKREALMALMAMELRAELSPTSPTPKTRAARTK